jgi:hypothetical protein
MLNKQGGIQHLHPELEDHPKVAAIDDGGPPSHPGNLTEPVEFHYEVSPYSSAASLMLMR